jgi:hypothetical protein
MHNLSIQKAENLSSGVKAALESLLGRPLEAGEEISVMAFRPHEAPQGSARKHLAQQLSTQMNEMERRTQDASEQELDEILDEGMRSVRPGYRPIK